MYVAAIIPAYNEEETITCVLRVVKSHPRIDEIVVVSDGSNDATAEKARAEKVKVVELEENIGKGGAIRIGLDHTRADIIIFLDADLVGLTAGHLDRLLHPVLIGEADMTIGLFEQGRLATDLAQKLAPHLSGQRALRREVIEDIVDLDETEFGLEAALTRHFRQQGYSCSEIELSDLTHIMKEEKMGLYEGFKQRIKMFWQVAKNMVR